ncbi:FtsX-like permease family protein [Terrisporobacter petrolearius]|uniref:ABC transporter permease n=1 Tax=Terrisporobacter petrolearius TaxID=1460447 RepID=UPI001D16A9B6|nr:ABC transporter permease [Terrisporobacter petrolearius]MCC3866397.1 FtsX-like permease family protein [Terrisporobacter petrolearius]
MGIYLKMSMAYLKKNKLRTLLLILGVAIGVSLIFGTSVIKESQANNDVKAIYKLYGGYHLEFSDLKKSDIEKVSKDGDVEKITTVENLGNIVDEKGNSFPLKSADKNYMESKSGKLTKGRLPKNKDELVMEEDALEAMNLSNKLNTTLTFKIKKKYKDSQGNDKIYTEDKKFKLVGTIEKPEGFYDFYDISIPFEAFTYGNSEKNNVIPQNIITYNSVLNLKSGWQNIDGQANRIIGENNLKEVGYTPNMPLVRQLMDKKIEKEDPGALKREILIIITAAIFVFNLFNITLNETIEGMGMLRLIGANKRSVRRMIMYQGIIIITLGIILGLIFGVAFSYVGLKNIGRNKSRALISIISIALGGYIFLTTFSSMHNEVTDKIANMQKRYDITIGFGINSDLDVVKYTDNDVNKLENIDGVKNINAVQVSKGFFDYKNYEVNKNFTNIGQSQEKNKMEYEMDFKLYGNDYINSTLKNFVQEGNINDLGKVTNNYANVAVYNYFYDENDPGNKKNVFTNLKIGDILTIRVPTTQDNETVYKESKVRVCTILKSDWMSKGDGSLGRNFEVIISNNHAKDLIGEKKYTKLGINLVNPSDKAVNKKVEEVSNSIQLSEFESKLSFNEMQKNSIKDYMKTQISTITLVLIIAGINIFCTIKTNLLIRKKEILTLRALGMSVKNMKKMIAFEALSYALLSFIIALIPSVANLTKFVNWNNNAYKNYGIDSFMSFAFPVKESILFFIITVAVCLIAVMTSSRDLKNMNIIDGIKDND